jgi:hypothetical protein
LSKPPPSAEIITVAAGAEFLAKVLICALVNSTIELLEKFDSHRLPLASNATVEHPDRSALRITRCGRVVSVP